MRSHPVLIILSSCCSAWDKNENVCVTSPKDIPYNRDTAIKWLLLKPGPRPWTWTQKNYTWTVKNLDLEKPGP